MPRPELVGLRLGDSPERWTALGFEVDNGVLSLGGVMVELGAGGRGILGWRLRGIAAIDSLDGLATEVVHEAAERG